MKILTPLKFILNHPLTSRRRIFSMLRFLHWQIFSIISKNGIIFKWIGDAKLFVKKGMHGATGNYYAYLHDFEEMSFLLHFLKTSDIFWDIGANIGSYTILASKVAGAKVKAFEPVPVSYKYLCKNIEINQVSGLVELFNIGLSDNDGKLYFTTCLDTINHVSYQGDKNTVHVQVDTCDNILIKTTAAPSLIKLDVEGYEYPVLKGAQNILRNRQLLAIIIELNGLGKNFGYDDIQIHQLLSESDFSPYSYHPLSRTLTALSWPHHKANVIYCRNVEGIKQRLRNALDIHAPGIAY